MRVRLQAATGITIAGHPAVVEGDQVVANVPVALVHEEVCHLHEQVLTGKTTGLVYDTSSRSEQKALIYSLMHNSE